MFGNIFIRHSLTVFVTSMIYCRKINLTGVFHAARTPAHHAVVTPPVDIPTKLIHVFLTEMTGAERDHQQKGYDEDEAQSQFLPIQHQVLDSRLLLRLLI